MTDPASGKNQFPQETTARGREGTGKNKLRWRIVTGVSSGLVLAVAGVTVGLYLTRLIPAPPPGPPCSQCMAPKPANLAMKTVLGAIRAENRTVLAHDKQWVSIVLLTPLAPATGSDVTVTRMVNELRGAYDAQLAMDGAAETIGVQVLVDNEGSSQEEQEGPAIRQLKFVAEADHVVAVVGMGVSNSETAAAGSTLNAFDMPMIATVASADRFSAPPSPGMYPDMVQVVPNVSAQVSELVGRLGKLGSAILVFDSSTSDYYTGDLRADFTNNFSLSGQPQPYASNEDPNGQFRLTAQEVCSPQTPPVVLYAGRQIVLSAFITQLMAYNGCAHKNVTIVTTADADGLQLSSTADHFGDGHVSVVYTDIMDLSRLTRSFRKTYGLSLTTVDPGGTGLRDTWMTATYNGMEAAYTAIQQAYAGGSSIPTRGMVRSYIDRLNTGLQVTGAAGNFSLSQYGRLITSTVPMFADINDKRVPFSPAVAKELGLG